MIVFSLSRIFFPAFTALRTSSSHTHGTGCEDVEGAGAGNGVDDDAIEGPDGPMWVEADAAIPRDARNASMRRVSASAAIGSAGGFAGACGSFGETARGSPAIGGLTGAGWLAAE
jgi:hypothetical protein